MLGAPLRSVEVGDVARPTVARRRAHSTSGSAFCTVARDQHSLFDLAVPRLPGITEVKCLFHLSGNCLLRPRGELVGVKIDHLYLGKAREG